MTEQSTPDPGGESLQPVEPESSITLLTEKQFGPDLVEQISKATGQVVVRSMQLEISEDTEPLVEQVVAAHERGVDTTVRLDRVARKHIWIGESQAWLHKGRPIYHRGDKQALADANQKREGLFQRLSSLNILNPDFHKRGKNKVLSHDHIKMALVDGVAWLGTMNLRAKDFSISNFMMKITDSRLVAAIKEINGQIENNSLHEDRVVSVQDANGQSHTELLVDAGKRFKSVIYDRAVEMVQSLEPGDEFTLISQWPPAKSMFGRILKKMDAKTEQGVKGEFLMSPPEYHHPVKKAGNWLQRKIDKKYGDNPNVLAKNLARQTHAKALVIKRADGRLEVLVGSHNLTRGTVRNGTRELAMWTNNAKVVNQVINFIDDLQKE